jgi:hypothetical protein
LDIGTAIQLPPTVLIRRVLGARVSLAGFRSVGDRAAAAGARDTVVVVVAIADGLRLVAVLLRLGQCLAVAVPDGAGVRAHLVLEALVGTELQNSNRNGIRVATADRSERGPAGGKDQGEYRLHCYCRVEILAWSGL